MYLNDAYKGSEAFSKIKGGLRKAVARGREALIEALGVAISAVSARDARGSSSMVATIYPSIFYETRCKRIMRRKSRWANIIATRYERSSRSLCLLEEHSLIEEHRIS
jgi:hypothetical protein